MQLVGILAESSELISSPMVCANKIMDEKNMLPTSTTLSLTYELNNIYF
ncbi:Uncharacterised protein [Legionella oakridgensis]|nr:hypothetical protein LLB_3110 [Legionella longbeachae D-4968]VEE03207.1 Uncharacterised protein [Legionella oakridgensis]